ncbi:uncharacterized protein LOC114301906 [Camellia sinensis]|uniref:uncharacterized protein LOC114301906 n=1 Tax=Camellia sinensis TaxID=4442 RepID=UPI001036D8B7|nr:uncharacterized protein LOC114301906 [Camellia sinensis]
MDKSWMSSRNRLSSEYREGVKSFLQFAMTNVGVDNRIRYPCMDCLNFEHHTFKDVEYHLIQKGISLSYKTWVHHGVTVSVNQPRVWNNDNDIEGVGDEGTTNECLHIEDELYDMLDDCHMAHIFDDDEEGEQNDNEQREDGRNFDKLLEDARRPLYLGCQKFTLLSFVVKMLHIKVLNKWSNKSFDMLLGVLKDLLPESDQKVPWTLYEVKKFLRDLGLGYVPIHACKYDYALFWKENVNLENCSICKEPRYKMNDGKGKKIPHKILRYFPLTPRLQRLYMLRKTAGDMRWHKEKRVDDGILRHPADGEAWKDFDRQHAVFAQEPRNVRLGLATDGFNPIPNDVFQQDETTEIFQINIADSISNTLRRTDIAPDIIPSQVVLQSSTSVHVEGPNRDDFICDDNDQHSNDPSDDEDEFHSHSNSDTDDDIEP